VRLGGIVVIGSTGEVIPQRQHKPALVNSEKDTLLGEPLGCVEIGGRSMTERSIERLVEAGVEVITVLLPENFRKPKFRASFANVCFQTVSDHSAAISDILVRYAANDVEHSFVMSADAYAETDLLDLYYFHHESRQAVTRTFDRHGSLALWVVNCSKANEPNFEISLVQAQTGPSPAVGGSYFIREYVNRLTHPRDLRQFAEDSLRGRCESRPSGKQIRPGVWMDDKAEVHRRARIVAPAYIGCRSEIKAEAVVTRFSSIERDCCIDCGTVVEDSSVLADTNVGIWLDVCHAVVSGKKLLSLSRDVAVEISDVSIVRSRNATNSRVKRNKDSDVVGDSKKVFRKEQSVPRWQPDVESFPGVAKMSSKGPVIIMELPEQLKQGEVKTFMRELQPLLDTSRPCVVLDCSKIQDIDSAGVEMLLECLEMAMKRDGDLKLAAVSPASAIILELMRVDRLFEVFDTAEEATHSFQVFAPAVAPQSQPWYSAGYGLADLKTAN
jgi:anti-anti-sigma factor